MIYRKLFWVANSKHRKHVTLIVTLRTVVGVVARDVPDFTLAP